MPVRNSVGVRKVTAEVAWHDGAVDPAQVDGERRGAALDPQERRAVLGREEVILVAHDRVGRVAAQVGAALALVEEERAQEVLLDEAAEPEERALVADADAAAVEERERLQARPRRREVLRPGPGDLRRVEAAAERGIRDLQRQLQRAVPPAR